MWSAGCSCSVIARETGERLTEGNALGNLGLAWADLGDVQKAIGIYDQRLVIAREIGDRRSEGEGSFILALALASLGHRDHAIAHAELALTILQAIESPRADIVRRQLADWGAQSTSTGGDLAGSDL